MKRTASWSSSTSVVEQEEPRITRRQVQEYALIADLAECLQLLARFTQNPALWQDRKDVRKAESTLSGILERRGVDGLIRDYWGLSDEVDADAEVIKQMRSLRAEARKALRVTAKPAAPVKAAKPAPARVAKTPAKHSAKKGKK